MKLSSLLEQGPVVGALVGAASRGLGLALSGEAAKRDLLSRVTLPATELREVVGGRSAALVREYLRCVGGDAASWPSEVPSHMFPQWTFPIAAKTLFELNVPLWSVLNGGCRLIRHGAIRTGDPIELRAQLASVDESPRRYVFTQHLNCASARQGQGLTATLYAVVPKKSSKVERHGGTHRDRVEKRREMVVVPLDAEQIAKWRLPPSAGLDFAAVTGDFNPVHWVPAYARAMGFHAPILHGFASMARTWESLARVLLAGDSTGIEELDVRFVRPLALPQQVGLFRRDNQIWIALARGSQAYMSGTFRASRLGSI